MIDNKTINYITLPLHKAYPVISVATSNLKHKRVIGFLSPFHRNTP